MNSLRRLALSSAVLICSATLLMAQQAPTSVTTTPSPAPAAPKSKWLPAHINQVTDAADLPVSVTAKDPNIRYISRFDLSANPTASWTASSMLLKFHGTALNAVLNDASGTDFWEVEIDGKPTLKMPLGKGPHTYSLASGLADGDHVVRLLKATEGGVTEFQGFQISAGGSILPPPPDSPYHLEIIGDSITCGAANEGVPGIWQPSNLWENAYYAYGAVTARRFGADLICVANSGWKLYPGPDKLIPAVYDNTLGNNPKVAWDFSRFTADAVVINLSTNDFSHGAYEDQAGWITNYKQFITRLRSHYPNAEIYCASSPMLLGRNLTASLVCLKKIVADVNAAGDKKVEFITLPTQDPKDGIGGGHHPNFKTHQLIADAISAHLISDLGWKPVAP